MPPPLQRKVTRRAFNLFSPLTQLGICIALVTASELLLKRGAAETAEAVSSLPWLGFTSLASGWIWAGILCILLSLGSWLYVLKYVDLSVAYAAAASVYALVPIGGRIFFGEAISASRWIGIAVIVVGLGLIAPDAIKSEQKP